MNSKARIAVSQIVEKIELIVGICIVILFGFTGMIIGVPLFAVIYFLTKERIRDNLKRKNITIE